MKWKLAIYNCWFGVCSLCPLAQFLVFTWLLVHAPPQRSHFSRTGCALGYSELVQTNLTIRKKEIAAEEHGYTCQTQENPVPLILKSRRAEKRSASNNIGKLLQRVYHFRKLGLIIKGQQFFSKVVGFSSFDYPSPALRDFTNENFSRTGNFTKKKFRVAVISGGLLEGW